MTILLVTLAAAFGYVLGSTLASNRAFESAQKQSEQSYVDGFMAGAASRERAGA